MQIKNAQTETGPRGERWQEDVNWIVEEETGEEAVELPEERGGWAEARRK